MTKVVRCHFPNKVQNTVISVLLIISSLAVNLLPSHLLTGMKQAARLCDDLWRSHMRNNQKNLWPTAQKKLRPSSNSSRGTKFCQQPSEFGSHSSPAERPDDTAVLSDILTTACERVWSRGSN